MRDGSFAGGGFGAGFLDAQSKAFEITSGEVNVAPDLRLKLGSSVTLKVRVVGSAVVEISRMRAGNRTSGLDVSETSGRVRAVTSWLRPPSGNSPLLLLRIRE